MLRFTLKNAKSSTHLIAIALFFLQLFVKHFLDYPQAVVWLGAHWFTHYMLDTVTVAIPSAVVYLQPLNGSGGADATHTV